MTEDTKSIIDAALDAMAKASLAWTLALDTLVSLPDEAGPVKELALRMATERCFAAASGPTEIAMVKSARAEYLRPKGKPVLIHTFTWRGTRHVETTEYVRETATQIVLRHVGAEYRFLKTNGRAVKARLNWCIPQEELDRLVAETAAQATTPSR